MKQLLLFSTFFFLFSCSPKDTKKETEKKQQPEKKTAASDKIQKSPLTIGESMTFHSKILAETRTLNIYLPHGYHPDSLKKYPVIYLLDGSIDEDIIHISGIVQFASFPWINQTPPSIIVGIANTDRKRDFTFPTNIEKDKKEFPTTGGSAAFIRFIAEEVQPLVEKEYTTDTLLTLIGQSLGGLLATEILCTQPDLFDQYIIVSPSLWWDDVSLLKRAPVPTIHKKKVWIAVGNEGKEMIEPAKQLHELMRQRPNFTSSYHYYDHLDHSNILHEAVYEVMMGE